MIYRNPNKKSTLEEDIVKVEDALGDQYKKQSVTTLAATLTYGDEDADTKIYYHILKTDYYEQDASEITGLNTVAFGVLFPVEFMDSCEEMKIQEWPAAIYKKGEMAYLCWTYPPKSVMLWNISLRKFRIQRLSKWRKVQRRGISREYL